MDTTWNETTAAPDTIPPAPAPPAPQAQAEAATATATKKSGGRAKIVFAVLCALAATGGGASYALGLGVESTDDAQVEGHIVNVATRLPGQVTRVLVADNQLVEPGDVLVQLDDRDVVARLAGARADLASAQAALAAAKAQLALTERSIDANLKQASGGIAQANAGFMSARAAADQARADIAAAESKRQLAALELGRAESLGDHGAISQTEVDSRRAAAEQADALVAQAKARLDGAIASSASSSGAFQAAQGKLAQAQTGPEQLDAARAAASLAAARVEQAEAAVKLAELNVSYTKVTAPSRGVVSRRNVEIGQMISPERPLLALVPPDDVWVVANFKEDQITGMRTGQPVTVKVDTYGRREFKGHIDSIAGASGARFALLPPDNASGNFVKVVQRIPVLIRFDEQLDVPLRPGMSAFASVDVKGVKEAQDTKPRGGAISVSARDARTD